MKEIICEGDKATPKALQGQSVIRTGDLRASARKFSKGGRFLVQSIGTPQFYFKDRTFP